MIADRMGQFVQAYTLYSSVRPFGCSTLIATYDNVGPSLYMIDPSGVYWVSKKKKKLYMKIIKFIICKVIIYL